MTKKKFTKKRCREIGAGIDNAMKREDFKEAIYLSQQAGFYSHAAQIAEKTNQFQEAYNILKLGKHEDSDSLDKEQCSRDFYDLNQRLFPETSLENEFYLNGSNLFKINREIKAFGNWRDNFGNKTDDYLTRPFRGNQGLKKFRTQN